MDKQEAIFKKLYKEYYYKALHFCNQYLNDYEASKEIVQDVLLSIWEKRDSLDSDQNLGSYLMTSIRNRSLNYLRNKFSKMKISETDCIGNEQLFDLLVSKRALEDDSSSILQGKELEDIIKQTLNNLPEKIKEVFLMNRDGNFTYPQIAVKLEVSVKTVEYRMSRALQIFRESLKDYLILGFLLTIPSLLSLIFNLGETNCLVL